MSSMKSIISIFAIFVLSLLPLAGCGPQPPASSEIHGEVVTDVPEVPGTNEPYKFSQPLKNSKEKQVDSESLSK